MLSMSEEAYLIVRDSVWVPRFRALYLIVMGCILAVAARYDTNGAAWTIFAVFMVGGIAMLLTTFNPQTRLVVDATGVWTAGYDTIEWEQLASFYYTEYNGTEDSSAYLVFTTYASQQINVDMDAADTGVDIIREAIKRFNTNALLRDQGQQ